MKSFQLETREYYFIVSSDDPCGYYKTPVVGWAMFDDDMLALIIENGKIEAIPNTYSIVLPSGIVYASDGREFESVEQWMKRNV
mgnify:CR=1 FL=1